LLELPILLWDERWSTQAVERAMIDADVSRARRAEKIDALAAAHILQGAIDRLASLDLNPIRGPLAGHIRRGREWLSITGYSRG